MALVSSEPIAEVPKQGGRADVGVAPGGGAGGAGDMGGAAGGAGVPNSDSSPGAANRIQSLREVVSSLFMVFYATTR